MKIQQSTLEDIDAIFERYEDATIYQKQVGVKSWKGFDRASVEKEIIENRHFKIMEGDVLACTFLIAFNNPVIWQDNGEDKAIYIHRIATNPNYRGRSYVKQIVAWALSFGKENKLSFIRLDTHSGNERINQYYEKCGFIFKGIRAIQWTDDLPIHYKDGPFSLFEIQL